MKSFVRSQVMMSVDVSLLRVLMLPHALHAEDVQLRHRDFADRLIRMLANFALLIINIFHCDNGIGVR